jgi:hypothetical protein
VSDVEIAHDRRHRKARAWAGASSHAGVDSILPFVDFPHLNGSLRELPAGGGSESETLIQLIIHGILVVFLLGAITLVVHSPKGGAFLTAKKIPYRPHRYAR